MAWLNRFDLVLTLLETSDFSWQDAEWKDSRSFRMHVGASPWFASNSVSIFLELFFLQVRTRMPKPRKCWLAMHRISCNRWKKPSKRLKWHRRKFAWPKTVFVFGGLGEWFRKIQNLSWSEQSCNTFVFFSILSDLSRKITALIVINLFNRSALCDFLSMFIVLIFVFFSKTRRGKYLR